MTSIAILHYSASPVVGGVEAVMDAHAGLLAAAGYDVSIVAGRGAQDALPAGVRFVAIPEMDSQHPHILAASAALEQGELPADFDALTAHLEERLRPAVAGCDHVIVHNLFTKHFNLPLSAALDRLLDEGAIRHAIAWCHDFTWTSPNSRHKVHPGWPWDLLRRQRQDVTYVVVSIRRQEELAGLYGCAPDMIRVVYNGVDPAALLGLSPTGQALMERLDLFVAGLILLMPVRVTQAKNIEFAMQVVAALKAAGTDPKLVLTGPPDPHDEGSMAYFRSLQALRARLGVEDEMRFVFESGPEPGEPYFIDLAVVGDLMRLADVMFMPSHREGFGMPVLEAGLAGTPAAASSATPAAVEIGGESTLLFAADADAGDVAAQLLAWLEANPQHRLRRHVRQRLTWEAIYRHDIEPLLHR